MLCPDGIIPRMPHIHDHRRARRGHDRDGGGIVARGVHAARHDRAVIRETLDHRAIHKHTHGVASCCWRERGCAPVAHHIGIEARCAAVDIELAGGHIDANYRGLGGIGGAAHVQRHRLRAGDPQLDFAGITRNG